MERWPPFPYQSVIKGNLDKFNDPDSYRAIQIIHFILRKLWLLFFLEKEFISSKV